MRGPEERGKTEPAKVVAIVLMAVFAALSLALTIVQFSRGKTEFAMRGIFFPVFLLIPLLFRLLKLKHCWRLYTVVYLFCLFAYCYGSIWGGFKISYQASFIPPFLPVGWQQAMREGMFMDKVSHLLSGFLFTMLGFCLFYRQAGPPKRGLGSDWLLSGGYALFFSTFVAVLWEVFEFFDFALTGNDSQNHLTTGVMDTMYDVMSCLLASVLSVLAFLLWRKTKVKLLTAWVVEEFYDKNVAGRPGRAE